MVGGKEGTTSRVARLYYTCRTSNYTRSDHASGVSKVCYIHTDCVDPTTTTLDMRGSTDKRKERKIYVFEVCNTYLADKARDPMLTASGSCSACFLWLSVGGRVGR